MPPSSSDPGEIRASEGEVVEVYDEHVKPGDRQPTFNSDAEAKAWLVEQLAAEPVTAEQLMESYADTGVWPGTDEAPHEVEPSHMVKRSGWRLDAERFKFDATSTGFGMTLGHFVYSHSGWLIGGAAAYVFGRVAWSRRLNAD